MTECSRRLGGKSCLTALLRFVAGVGMLLLLVGLYVYNYAVFCSWSSPGACKQRLFLAFFVCCFFVDYQTIISRLHAPICVSRRPPNRRNIERRTPGLVGYLPMFLHLSYSLRVSKKHFFVIPPAGVVDNMWNDIFMRLIVSNIVTYLAPTHCAVMGDLLSSQRISDDEFAKRVERYNWIFAPAAQLHVRLQ